MPTTATDPTLIGIDIGTTAVKAVLLGRDGQRRAAFSRPYPTRRPAEGRVEQDAGDWARLAREALALFAAHPDRGEVAGIGLTAQVGTHVFVGADLAPLAPAMVWQDTRAAAAGAALDARIAPADKLAWLGAPIPVDASHPLARMAWMATAAPGTWARTAVVMQPKDYVAASLTGQVAADPLSAIGMAGTDLRYAGALIALVPGAAERLPPLVDPLAEVGRIAPGLPLAGTPVFTGTMDAWVSMLGLGVAAEGSAMYLSGTSEVMGIVSATRLPEPGVVTFPGWAGITLHAGPTQAGGAALVWVARLTGQDVGAAASGAAMPEATSPLFLPHLQGERAPLWDASARGTFAGLTLGDGAPEVTGAVLEGVAFAARLSFEALTRSAGLRPGLLRAGGGGMASDRWCKIRADAFGLPLQRMTGTDPGAVGAAVMAGAGSGLMADLVQAAALLATPEQLFTPDAGASARADRRFALWQELYAQIRPINAALA
ncbi:MAG: carbohydrate kinase [Limimaricola sp.]|uniref:xylulokinase n=1 Tax=Limimaricola sp. TaxID=2211665 RepID=UPI001D94F62D|nr:FGGY-family carbohydrate kinase [Limimaricola sp.]MBI1416585.1 carbohydrate kinase [Limimaricola sp.]